jgi:hypothetical protein
VSILAKVFAISERSYTAPFRIWPSAPDDNGQKYNTLLLICKIFGDKALHKNGIVVKTMPSEILYGQKFAGLIEPQPPLF